MDKMIVCLGFTSNNPGEVREVKQNWPWVNNYWSWVIETAIHYTSLYFFLIFLKFSTSNIFQNYYIRIGFVSVFIATSLTVLKEVTFQDRATGEIHKLLPRLYRFTKIPYAQCTLLKKSKNILWEEELKDASTYSICFPWSQLSGDASSHTATNTVWGPGSDFYVDTRKIVYFIKEHSTIMQYETSQLLFCAVSLGSIAIVLFSLSCSLTLLMPLPQVAWQHNYLCKKKKK